MGWNQAAPCELLLDLPLRAKSSQDETPCPDDFDFPQERTPDRSRITDTALEDILSADDLPGALLEKPWAATNREPFRSKAGLIVSLMAHAALLAVLFCMSIHTSTGDGEAGERVVSIRLMDGDLFVPREESPGTTHSVPSVASVAARRRHVKTETVKPSRPEPLQHVGTDADVEREIRDLPDLIQKTEESSRAEALDDGPAVPDREKVESPSNTDSAASIPSAAYSRRRLLSSAGAEPVDFRAGVLSAIEASAYFPLKALRKGLVGQSLVQFTIWRDGSITGLSCVRTSGSEELDQAALRIIEKASKKFPPFPEHVPKESVSYVVPIAFKAKAAAGG
jgi:TonB family protein